jgi:UDP-N-acetyl-D-galactosamine dehydrogenase
MHDLSSLKIAVVGLGYVGLPLAVELTKRFDVVGFDVNEERVRALRNGKDATREVSSAQLAAAADLRFESDLQAIAGCNFYIVTVPTPIDAYRRPDLSPLMSASRAIGSVLKRGDLVIYESTVYPGCTEEQCVPLLESTSGLVFNRDFHVGYSPERINPGDTTHKLPDIRKVTSGSTPEAAELIDAVYASVIRAGTFKAKSIRIAEAAKVIENTQRDVNIALINELAILFNRLDIDTQSVLDAAGTKWNFLPFRPGLVGGHCIGVDPYYLTHKAQEVGHHPGIILAGRRTNDDMGSYLASRMIKAMLSRGMGVQGARILVLGLTFKENCPDLRNTKVVDLIEELSAYHAMVDVHDPWADPDEALHELGITLTQNPCTGAYDGIILAVPHTQFEQWGAQEIRRFGSDPHVFFDLKSVFPLGESDLRL